MDILPYVTIVTLLFIALWLRRSANAMREQRRREHELGLLLMRGAYHNGDHWRLDAIDRAQGDVDKVLAKWVRARNGEGQ
jgi:hypothetical protein